MPLGIQNKRFFAPYQCPYIPPNECSKDNRNQVNLGMTKDRIYPQELIRNLYVIVKDFEEEENPPNDQAGRAYANLISTEEVQQKIQFLNLFE